MRISILIFVSLICGAGCSCATQVSESQPKLTGEVARDALLDLIRNQPDLFVGSPDPDRLAKIAIKDQRDGAYHWGLFVIDPAARTYSADLNTSGPGEAYFYNGKFELRWRQWTASRPNVQRMHHPR